MPARRAVGTAGQPGMRATLTAAAERILADLAGRGRLELTGIGWATVELARAERELTEALQEDLVAGFEPAADDGIMGAYARVGRMAGGLALVLLEPNTEGRLAGALARWGEAVVVAYAVTPPWRAEGREAQRERQVEVAWTASGPLGPARYLAGGRRGPHVIVVKQGAGDGAAARLVAGSDTIAP